MENSLVQNLVRSVLETEDIEIGCVECFELLDNYAELLLEGRDPAEIMPMVKQHLKQCNCCDHELQALMVMIQEAARSDNTANN